MCCGLLLEAFVVIPNPECLDFTKRYDEPRFLSGTALYSTHVVDFSHSS